MGANSPPDVGSRICLRERLCVADAVLRSGLLGTPLEYPTPEGRQHLVSATSLDDDGLGDELRVLREVQPGTRAIDCANLPEVTFFDDPTRLDAFFAAGRWATVSSADARALQSPFTAGITIEDYQLDPVVRALQMPRALPITDDLGLGKTIETAPHFEHELFLTATSHIGYSENFGALLELLDDRRCHRGVALEWERHGAVTVAEQPVTGARP